MYDEIRFMDVYEKLVFVNIYKYSWNILKKY